MTCAPPSGTASGTLHDAHAEVITTARALKDALAIGIHDHLLGIATYQAHPPENDYQAGHMDEMVTFFHEKLSVWVPLHDRLREAFERLDRPSVAPEVQPPCDVEVP